MITDTDAEGDETMVPRTICWEELLVGEGMSAGIDRSRGVARREVSSSAGDILGLFRRDDRDITVCFDLTGDTAALATRRVE